MITSLALARVLFCVSAGIPLPLTLKYGRLLDDAFELQKQRHPTSLSVRSRLEYNRLSAQKGVSPEKLISFGAGLIALNMVHLNKFEWPESDRSGRWFHTELKNLEPCLEVAIIDYYATNFYDVVEPEHIARKSLPNSPLGSMFAFKCWDMRVKTDDDLQEMKTLWSRIQQIGIHKRYLLGTAGSLEFNTFQATRNFKSLRKATDLYKAGAKLDPSPKALTTTINWCKPWDDWAAKEGK